MPWWCTHRALCSDHNRARYDLLFTEVAKQGKKTPRTDSASQYRQQLTMRVGSDTAGAAATAPQVSVGDDADEALQAVSLFGTSKVSMKVVRLGHPSFVLSSDLTQLAAVSIKARR